MSNLPVETIEEILGYVNEDDISTFLSLSLVNRTWCHQSIPHLWKKPFGVKSKNLYKIITIILSYLDDQQKSVLKLNKKKVGIPTSKLTYNYPSYIRQLDFNKLFSLITEWITKNKKVLPKLKQDYFIKNSDQFTFDFSIFKEDEEEYELNFSYTRYIERCCLKDQEKLAFFEYIFKVIIERSRGIRKLFVEIYYENEEIPYTIPKDFFGHIFRLKQVGKCFAGLTEFTCRGNFHKASLINEIKKHSHGIRKLTIYPWEVNYVNNLKTKDIRELFKVQKNLRSLSISVDSEIRRNAIECIQGMMVNTLESFQMKYGDITNNELKHLSKCKKMMRLHFDTVYFDEPINMFGDIIYPDLEELVFFNCNFSNSSIDMLKEFIKKNGSNLRSLQLSPSNSDISISGILSSLSEHCFNLNHLHVNIDNQCDIILLFKILQQLKHSLILLNVGYCKNKPKFNANDYMKEFTEIFSTTNIVNLNIRNWEISLEMFEVFIKECGKILKVFEGSCVGSEEDLENLIQSTSKLHSRKLDRSVIEEIDENEEIEEDDEEVEEVEDGEVEKNGEFKNIKIIWN